MTRRASLPGVDALFRSPQAPVPPTPTEVDEPPSTAIDEGRSPSTDESPSQQVAEGPKSQGGSVLHVVTASSAPLVSPTVAIPAPPPPARAATDDSRRPRHDEKVTFYCTASDLTRIERARLTLRAEHRLASDRGRIVRAALEAILDDFEARGADSALVIRLRSPDTQVDK